MSGFLTLLLIGEGSRQNLTWRHGGRSTVGVQYVVHVGFSPSVLCQNSAQWDAQDFTPSAGV